MPNVGNEDSRYPRLAGGHERDGNEDWADLLVIEKGQIDNPDGPRPTYSTAHLCHACRAELQGEGLGSMAEADAWLRVGLA
ncbi:hypothetical protein [Rubellimicrobium roseum]|uniref:Uncharacterized protein n=1 Tax=Rubellimicrobium roseum TaxID=687525 RepID=A0A5C4N973_9RHOB|nr:hypothetical protein [Rubellimicrobium roseum]TNC59860.1 hypothetical protein FHG71_22475 [Rubellimicrobium roseum]